jgi:hypothetical protein
LTWPPNPLLLDSITAINATALNAVIVSGSHGGRSSTGFATANPQKPLLVFFNDAGGGKDNAGIYCLEALQTLGIACACYSHSSARIGEALDGYNNGIISFVNLTAQALHLTIGMTVKEACHLVLVTSSNR